MSSDNSPAVWQTVSDLIPFPIYVADVTNFEVVATNQPMRERIGERLGEPCYRAIYQFDAPCPFCRITQLQSAQSTKSVAADVVFEYFNESDDHWYQLQERLMTWFDGACVKYSIAVNISALKAVQNELAEAHVKISFQNMELKVMSVTDGLTGLFNRRKIDESIANEVERRSRYGQPLSVVMIDIDHFKRVNDAHGHLKGDLVLLAIADVLRQGVRKIDIIGRWGGEEFLVICPNTDLDGAVAMAENMRQLVQAREVEGIGRATSSFGVAQLGPDEAAESLVQRVDAALYRAKLGGRNRVEADRPASALP
jgi:diguanylate cyclase (GGDEF)-like protein